MSLRKKQPEENEFGPLLTCQAFGGQTHLTRVLISMGCFRKYDYCPKCGSACSLRIKTSKKALKTGEVKEYNETSWRCSSWKCDITLSLTDDTIWSTIKDRTLFVFVVNAFINRSTTDSIVNNTGCKRSTAEKYMMFIKNALHLDVEESLNGLLLGGDEVSVQVDESCVFSRKYNVGRELRTTKHGWVFGIVENKPDGLLFLQMVEKRDSPTLKGLIQQHVKEGTTVFSDSWPSYDGVDKINGYQHYKVNHKEHFVEVQPEKLPLEEEQRMMQEAVRGFEVDDDNAFDSEDRQPERLIVVHTQKIERVWEEVKRGLYRQPLRLLKRNLNVEIFRFNKLRANMSFSERRKIVIQTVAKFQGEIEKLKVTNYPIYG